MEYKKYIAPEVEIMDVYTEGVLCGSLYENLDMDPEEGYM